METQSLWQAISRNPEKYPLLQSDTEVDVAIIGGGITGLTTAHHLVMSGKKVAILEAHRIGFGTTGNSTGNLYIETQPWFQNIKDKFSLDLAKKVAHLRKKAIDEIEKNVREMKINCNFSRRPWFVFAEEKDDIPLLDNEVKTLRALDIDIDYTTDLPLPFKYSKAATMPSQARINPLKYIQALAADLDKKGCLIFEESKVINIDEKGILLTPKGKVIAKKVIIATHTPVGVNAIQMYTAPYRSYAIAVRLKNGYCPEGQFWGIGKNQNISSTHSISDHNNPELLLVAGRHHKTGQGYDALRHFKELDEYLHKQKFEFERVHQWSAQHYQSADDVPYIGSAHRHGKNIYMATGYFADGLLYGTIAARILADLVIKGNNHDENIFNPWRSSFGKSLGFLTKENANVFLQYLKDLPFIFQKKHQDLKPGEGKIIMRNSEKLAVSRDEQNNLHVVSAVCTHMKCIVNWNNAEKTWDCPCHGSRFSMDGQVLEGPAIADLEKKNI